MENYHLKQIIEKEIIKTFKKESKKEQKEKDIQNQKYNLVIDKLNNKSILYNNDELCKIIQFFKYEIENGYNEDFNIYCNKLFNSIINIVKSIKDDIIQVLKNINDHNNIIYIRSLSDFFCFVKVFFIGFKKNSESYVESHKLIIKSFPTFIKNFYNIYENVFFLNGIHNQDSKINSKSNIHFNKLIINILKVNISLLSLFSNSIRSYENLIKNSIFDVFLEIANIQALNKLNHTQNSIFNKIISLLSVSYSLLGCLSNNFNEKTNKIMSDIIDVYNKIDIISTPKEIDKDIKLEIQYINDLRLGDLIYKNINNTSNQENDYFIIKKYKEFLISILKNIFLIMKNKENTFTVNLNDLINNIKLNDIINIIISNNKEKENETILICGLSNKYYIKSKYNDFYIKLDFLCFLIEEFSEYSMTLYSIIDNLIKKIISNWVSLSLADNHKVLLSFMSMLKILIKFTNNLYYIQIEDFFIKVFSIEVIKITNYYLNHTTENNKFPIKIRIFYEMIDFVIKIIDSSMFLFMKKEIKISLILLVDFILPQSQSKLKDSQLERLFQELNEVIVLNISKFYDIGLTVKISNAIDSMLNANKISLKYFQFSLHDSSQIILWEKEFNRLILSKENIEIHSNILDNEDNSGSVNSNEDDNVEKEIKVNLNEQNQKKNEVEPENYSYDMILDEERYKIQLNNRNISKKMNINYSLNEDFNDIIKNGDDTNEKQKLSNKNSLLHQLNQENIEKISQLKQKRNKSMVDNNEFHSYNQERKIQINDSEERNHFNLNSYEKFKMSIENYECFDSEYLSLDIPDIN